MKRNIITFALAALTLTPALAQEGENSTMVTIDHTVQRYLGDVSSLDRTKYFNIHSTSDSDPDVKAFLDEYGVGIGRGFYGPYSYSYDKTKVVNGYESDEVSKVVNNTSTRTAKRYIATEHPNPTQILNAETDPVKAGEWAVKYYNDLANDYVPQFFEPLNEPFVHSDEFGIDAQEMKVKMAQFFAEIGKQIHADPKLANMKVLGYASAYPSMELRNFQHWNDNMKMFMDQAGEHMDGLSVHLYDGVNIRGSHTLRSGSNSEAILDLVETYSYIKFGYVKPHATSEFGGIDDTYDEVTYDNAFDTRNAYKVLPSINHLFFNLMEREDKMLIAVPFISDKAEWYLKDEKNTSGYSYCAVLFMPENPSDLEGTAWTPNDKINLFKLWKGVSGERVEISSSNPDVQVMAFKNGNKLYIALDNLDSEEQKVVLSSKSGWAGNVAQVTERAFSVANVSYEFFPGDVSYSEVSHGPMIPAELTLVENQTTVLEIDLVDASGYENTVRRKKYYSRDYLADVSQNKALNFTFDGVEAGYGRGIARMSIAKPLNENEGFKFVKPIFKVNGVEVEVPDNWRGYDQLGREDFFGMIEIPFDLALVKNGQNVLSAEFPYSGGQVSSIVLQVERYDEIPVEVSTDIVNGDFEAEDLSAWMPFGQWGNALLDDEVKIEGERSLKISGVAGVAQEVSLSADTAYEVVCKGISDIDSSCKMMVEDMSTGELIASETFSTRPGVDMMRLLFNSKNATKVRISISADDIKQTMWIDNIYLIKE